MKNTPSGILKQDKAIFSNDLVFEKDTFIPANNITPTLIPSSIEVSSGDIVDCVGINKPNTKIFDISLKKIGSVVAEDTQTVVENITINANDITITVSSNQPNFIPTGTLVTFHKMWFKDDFDPDSLNDPTHNIVFAQGKCINLSNQAIQTRS